MGISNLMGKLHHKEDGQESAATPMPIPKPPTPPPKAEVEDQIPEEKPRPAPTKRWGAREVNKLDGDGIILDIGEGMSVNIPIKKRMSLEDFLKVAERVKRIEELNMGQPSYNEHMNEYH